MKYMSDDGKVFDSGQECSNHENKNKFLIRNANVDRQVGVQDVYIDILYF